MNKRLEWALVATIVAASVIGAGKAEARDASAVAARSVAAVPAQMPVGRQTLSPLGYVRFCEANPGECGGARRTAGVVVLDATALAQLRQVNSSVNGRIRPLTDIDHYGEVERWTYPDDGFGDCEDYVLLKRRTLISLGWPAETLLITVVRDRQGDGHSVLTVATDQGDLVLDNQEEAVLPWYDTGYRFVKRQAQTDADSWVSLGEVRAPTTVGGN
ncbi:MAG TPA: transglutaminase-like cysteine peptidase [Xanthobacteraceae bacterium]|nr:transglutaminase-like cysteine peptidase [Xanthobacteraceae bacterium]